MEMDPKAAPMFEGVFQNKSNSRTLNQMETRQDPMENNGRPPKRVLAQSGTRGISHGACTKRGSQIRRKNV